uniref:Protein artemis n=1 Tax=Megaselia scalaris TaxID=36166 RepID=T1H4J4_MEGSC
MFLFQCNDKNILYTGDFRISDFEAYSQLKDLALDKIYLDSTFLSPKFNYFPTQEESVSKICELSKRFLDKDDSNRVVILMPAKWCWLDFPFLITIYEYFNQPILVTNDVFQRYKSLEDIVVDEQQILTKDNINDDVKIILEYKGIRPTELSEQQFLGQRERELRKKYGKDLKIIIPSAFRWRNLKKDEEIVNGKHVACSFHCSFSELRNFVHHFDPEQIFLNVLTYDIIDFLKSKDLDPNNLSRENWNQLFNNNK